MATTRTQRPTSAWLSLVLLMLVTSPAATSVVAAPASARLVKVLPHLVDKQNRVALNPSLYERDAYQAYLRKTPSEQGGLRFDVQWKSGATNQFLLRLELRGNKGNVGTTAVLEQPVKYTGFFSTWTRIPLNAEAHAKLGELSAWRATLWAGDRLVSEQKSFLW